MEEYNHQTLQAAIANLPVYAPDYLIWEALQSELDEARQLKPAIDALPLYAPPPQVWEHIESDLDKKPRRLIFLKNWRYAVAAAALIGLAFIAVWRQQRLEKETVQFAYTTIESNFTAVANDWDSEEAVFQEIAEAYRQKSDLYQNKGRLLMELEELDEAKQEVKQMMNKYGVDAQLIKQIAEIERQRTAVLKKMAMEI